jgi:AcrR family transcriptional regulator
LAGSSERSPPIGDSETAKAIAVRRCDHYAGRFRAQRKADRRNRIAAAAVHLHAARDYADDAIADVCAYAKVSKRYVHVQSADREDLLQAVSLQAVSLQAFTADQRRFAAGQRSGAVDSLVIRRTGNVSTPEPVTPSIAADRRCAAIRPRCSRL